MTHILKIIFRKKVSGCLRFVFILKFFERVGGGGGTGVCAPNMIINDRDVNDKCRK